MIDNLTAYPDRIGYRKPIGVGLAGHLVVRHPRQQRQAPDPEQFDE